MKMLAAFTKHIRARLKAQGIAAKCSCYDSCGSHWIRIYPVAYGLEFTADEQRNICIIAKVNGCTMARGGEIDENRETYGPGVHFVVPPRAIERKWVAEKAIADTERKIAAAQTKLQEARG